MRKYVITIVLLFIIILISIGGYFIYSNAKTNESNNMDTLKEKANSEIKFLSANIISMMNELNNISYSKFEIVKEKIEVSNTDQENNIEEDSTINSSNVVTNNILSADKNKIDWDNLKSEIENMYSAWPTIIMDLTTLNVNKDNLLKYNSILDQITKDFENEDKESSLIHLADLHNLLGLYIKEFESDNKEVSLLNVKTNILYSYSFVSTEDCDKVIEYMAKAKKRIF